ncbi:Neuronal pentraxin-2 [Stylophora pistillata]|uniref:Neuronal pentraxin-2 n=1 Tax=Stylophora pistillata TaxID=50429 RepID=A0A2B4SXC1_STYPI|nr:Neuronal pentraxin-2 [Stylophora pistillata]
MTRYSLNERAVQQPTVAKMEVCVCMTRKNSLIHASASPFGPQKLVLIWLLVTAIPAKTGELVETESTDITVAAHQDFTGHSVKRLKVCLVQQRSTKRHTKKENAISSILSEFTVCFFVKMNDTNTNGEQCLYSYAEASSISGNGISVWLNYPKSRIGISVNKASGTDTGVGISDTMWHHICVTWKSSKGAWQLYMDGQLRSNKTGLNKNHKVPAGGTVVIGQDQDSAGGGFELSESFGPGEVTEVNLWNRVLSASDIAEQYANCHITKVGLMHWWEQFKDGVSDVTVIEP